MAFFSWSRWFRSLLRTKVKPIRKRPSSLRLEELETRLAPASFTWDGLGADNKWMTGANWVGGVAPTATAASLDDLVFQGTNQLASVNNFPAGATFNSITFSSGGFSLSGDAITLGSTAAAGSGRISVNNGLIGESIAFDINLGGAGSSGQQVFTVNPAAVLTIGTAAGGKLSGAATVGLTEQGGGTLILGQNNSGLLGAFTVASGSIVQITNNNGLGATNTTTIQQNAQLQLNNVGTVTENLKVSGSGVNGQGVIISTGPALSTDTLTGNVEIDSPVTFGGNLGTTLTFNGTAGQITDLGAGYTITKEGQNTVVFGTSNNYRGETVINNGVLEVQNSGAVGTNRITINTATLETGTLAIFDPTGNGITLSSQIQAFGAGFSGDGAVWNMQGYNTLSGQFILGPNRVFINTDVSGLDPLDSLTISGVVTSTGPGFTKIGAGELILTNSNTYTGGTIVAAGTLDITDSQALGPKATAGTTTVQAGATLELDVDNKVDSLTTTTNTLNLFTTLRLSGTGTDGQGALFSATGINIYYGQINLIADVNLDPVGIGVDPDPNQVNGTGYFTNEYSLTLANPVVGGNGPLVGGTQAVAAAIAGGGRNYNAGDLIDVVGGIFTTVAQLQVTSTGAGGSITGAIITQQDGDYQALPVNPTNPLGVVDVSNAAGVGASFNITWGGITINKYGVGQLILPQSNTGFTGNVTNPAPGNLGWDIRQGWVTIENNQSLGANLVNMSQSNQMAVTVEADASLQLKALPGQNLNIDQNFQLNGAGILHPFGLITEGALENIAGVNTLDGNVVLAGQVGIGVENVFGQPSQLTTIGTISQIPDTISAGGAFGTEAQHLIPLHVGSNGSVGPPISMTILSDVKGLPDDVRVYLGGNGTLSATGQPIPGVTGVLVYDNSLTPYPVVGWGTPSNKFPRWEAIITITYTSTQATINVVETPFNAADPAGVNYNPNFVNGSTTITYPALTSTNDEIVMNQVVKGIGNKDGSTGWTENITVVPPNVPGSLVKVGSGLLDIQGEGTYQGGTDIQQGVVINQNNTGLGVSGTPNTPNSVTVESGAALALANGTAYNNGGLNSGLAVNNTHLVINGGPEVQAISVGGATTGTFQVTFNGQTTGALSASIPASGGVGPTASLQNALNALSSIGGAGGSVAVTFSGGVYTVTFGGTLANFNQTQMSAVGAGGTTASVATITDGLGNTSLGVPLAPFSVLSSGTSVWSPGVTLVQSSAFLQGLTPAGSNTIIPTDAAWNGPVSLNVSTPIDVSPGSRLQITGAIDDAANTLGSDVIAMDTGELVLSGANTYKGTTYVGTSATAGGPGDDPDAVNEFFNPAAPAALGSAVLTVANSQGLGGTTNGTIVQGGSSLQLEGNITISGESLTVQGSGVGSASGIENWVQVGPAPIAGGQTLGTVPAAVSGMVTGIAVDPTDANTVYISTNGGGVWKTTDAGTSWLPIFDNTSTASNLFVGSVAVSTSNPQVVYLGTGVSNGAPNEPVGSYGGDGVYQSLNGGHSWTLVTGPAAEVGGPNPLLGLSVSKIVVDPKNPSLIYVATGDQALNGSNTAIAGIWRYDGTQWLNLTAQVSPNRLNKVGAVQAVPPHIPGPDDNYLYSFSQTKVTWSDVLLVGSGAFATLYAALGTPGGSSVTNYGVTSNANFVYFTVDPTAPGNAIVWDMGDGIADGETKGVDDNTALSPTAGNIKLTGTEYFGPNESFSGGNFTVYTAIADDANGTLDGVWQGKVAGGGGGALPFGDQFNWAAVSPPPAVTATDTQDNYDLAIYTPANGNGSNVYVGTQHNLQWTLNSGGAWTDITIDTSTAKNAPHADFLALAGYSLLAGAPAGITTSAVFAGTDGGIWSLNTLANVNTWSDLNAGLAISQINSVSENSTSSTASYVATQATGIAQNTANSTTWSVATNNGGASLYGADVVVDPNNPLNVYAFVTNSEVNFPGGVVVKTSPLLKSINGGTSFAPTGLSIVAMQQPALAIDTVVSSRLVVGAVTPNIALQESLNSGASFRNIGTNLPPGYSVTNVALAEYQGPFVADASFSSLADQGSSSYVPGTIYVTNSAIGVNKPTIELTKDYGNTWINRTPAQFAALPFYQISDLVVDPTNSNTVYITLNVFGASSFGNVYKSINGGQSWIDITGNLTAGLPAGLPTWKLTVDPRDNIIYVGTDNGVWARPSTGGQWQRIGNGMPNVQIKDLALDPATNILYAGTYGRSEYELLLNGTQANGGAFTVVSGSAFWTGSINLSGATTVGADGGATYQRNGINTATLTISGTISDLTPASGATDTITKVGTGNIVLSGTNTYLGVTDIQQGVLIVDSPQALGATSAGTIVEGGTALQLEQSISGEPLALNGNGPAAGFDGHFTGALESINNGLTYSGNITLGSDVTIGADSGSTLTITGNITGGFGITKELTGTLAFEPATANTYTGSTYVLQGVLLIEGSEALANSSGTFVVDGAQLQLMSPDGVTPVIITGETLDLTGAGISGSGSEGALLNVSGNNAWDGPVTLDYNPGFSPTTFPVGAGSKHEPAGAAIGVLNAADILTIGGSVGEASGLPSQLIKVGAGTLALAGTNTYTGGTVVSSGAVTVQNAQALGNAALTVNHLYAIDRSTLVSPNGTGTMTYGLYGQQTPSVTIGVSAATLQGYLDAILANEFGSNALANVTVTKTTINVPLVSGTPTPSFTEVVFSFLFGGTAMAALTTPVVAGQTVVGGLFHNEAQVVDGGTGVLVASGAALNVDLAASANGQTVTGEPVHISGAGTGANPAGAIDNLSGNNTWTSGITLDNSSSIGGSGGSLTVQGDVAGTPTAHLTKVGTGTLFFPNANDYGGTTEIQNGVLNIANPSALGLPSEIQTITLTGTLSGTFQVSFNLNGNIQQTGALSGTISALGLQNALDALSNIGGAGGSVNVLKVGNVYTVTFGGALTGINLNQMTTTGAGGAVATVSTVTDGGPITSEVDAVTVNGATTGSFTLTFKGQTTSALAANDPALVADMTAALNGLSTIGGVGGFVTVAQTVNVYNVTFGGTLAGQNLNGDLSATVTTGGGTVVVVSETTPGGLGATVVDNGGTLQLQGGITVTTEPLTLSGPGYNGMGALDSLAGANTWANPIALAASSAIGVDADAGATPGLTINQVISGAAAGTNLTKVGAATLNLTATNTYNGATFVNNGTLLLDDNGGMAVPGDVTVGDGVGAANSAIAQWLFNGEIPTTANVTVNGDGEFNLNNHTQTINNLKITDGTAQTGNTGALTLSSLGMTGGVLNTGTTGQVNLNGDVLATSDAATGAATISGTGGLALGSVVRTFNVTAGPGTPPAVDLDVRTPVTAPGNPGILKTGNGRLELDAVNAYGLTTVMGGDVEVDGTVGDVVLNGGNVSGTGADLTHGQVGNIGGPAGGVPKGIVSPGDNGAINPIGTLTVTPAGGSETWGAATGFAVDLNDATAAPGVGGDLLLVNGNLNLGGTQIAGGGGNNGGALLSGTVSGNVNVGDSFTIIETTGTISGVFQEPFLNNTVFIGGDKFTVAYNSQSVVLTRQINSTTLAVVSSANPSVYGQDVKFTATLTGEPGAVAPFLPSDQVKFTLHTPSSGDIVDIENVVNGKATFDAVANGALPPGTYLLDASFSGDQNYGPASVTGFQQNINQAVTTTILTPSPTNPVAGQVLTIYATVAPKAPGAGIPTGTVILAIDGGVANAANGGFTQSVSFDASFGGLVPFPENGLAVGAHTFTASYGGDANFKASNTAFPALSVTIAKDSDTMQLSAAPAGSAVVGQQVTFTASVTTNGPGTVVPSGTVNFLDGSKQIGTGTLAFDNATGGYDVSMQTSTLTLGKHTITAQYLGSAQELANQIVSSYTIAQVGTTTAISSSTGANPAVYGQTVTFTATVAAVAPGTGVPTGTVTFKDGSTTISTANLDGSGVASFTTATLAEGNHTITATYNGATTYAGSSASLTQQVQFSSATTVASSANPSVYQANVTFTAKVTPGVGMPAGTPTGQVNFVIDGTIANPTPLNLSGGQATYTAANLAPGTHSVVVEYLGSASYGTSNSITLTQNVQSGSTVTVARTAGSNPSTAGQPITFQAEITATAPGAPTPTGTVTFFDGSTNLGAQPVSAGVANLTISTLSVGVHSISATYNGDAVTAKSSSTAPVTQQITQATAAAAVTSSADPSSVNQAVTFTATVTASGNPVTTGNVTFLFDRGNANAANGGFQYTTALSNGQASYLVTALSKGSHTVVVNYTDPSGNYTNATSPTLTQNVLYATAIASLTSSANPASEGSPVTLTAGVSTSGVGTVTGTVDFVDTTTNTDLGTGIISAGLASISTSFSSLGTHAITATYSGDNNFATSSGTLNQQVRATVNVGLLLTSGNNPSVYTEPVTFQATVTPQVGGSPTPTGSVSFYSGTTLLTTVNLPAGSNQVSATVNNIPAGADNITATYSGDSNFGGNVSPAVSQNVNVDPTNTSVSSSAPTSTFGQSVTFTATVAPTGNATGVPHGTVTFLFDGGSANAANGGFQQTASLTNGQASISTSALTPSASPHTVEADYNGDPNGFGTSSGTLAGGQTVQNSTNPAFSYDAATKTLTVTGSNFTFAQATTDDAGGNLHSTYFFTVDGTTESFADTVVTHAVINGHGTAGTAVLITNDTYADNHGVTQETPETISLGSKSNAGVGTMLKYNGTSPFTFLTLSNFPISYAYVGRNDGTVSLYGSTSAAYNGFVSAGNYSYIGGPGLYHEAQGATSVYGYSSGQASDFAYHYAANAGSQYVVSGVAFSYMSTMDQNPSDKNATQSFFNVGVGFLQNTGVAKNPGQDYAYFIDSPGNDTFVGGTAYSYMYIPAPPSPYAEFDVAYGFALVYAQSFVGGTDTAVNNDPSHNILAGFNSTGGGNGRTGT